MVRRPRLILPGLPCHVTQRGNRRAPTFFEDGDYMLYRDLLAEAAAGPIARCGKSGDTREIREIRGHYTQLRQLRNG